MKKKLIFLGFAVICIFALVIALSLINFPSEKSAETNQLPVGYSTLIDSNNLNIPEPSPFLLGFCPTMKPYLPKVVQDKDFEIFVFESAGEALFALQNGWIDIVLIGRTARTEEINEGIVEKRLSSGYTLVSNEKKLIEYSLLKNLEIHTHLPEKTVNEFIPAAENIYFHNSFEETVFHLDKAVLINWTDFRDEFELVIPILNGLKVEKFRAPVIYYNKDSGFDPFLN